MRCFRAALCVAVLIPAASGFAGEPTSAITIRLVGPDEQARRIIDLFRGAKVPHPAAALAAWRRASREPNRLGKPLEALIAAINPRMAEDLRTLDGAEVALWSEPEGGRLAWNAILPDDDGTFAALATSLVLSGGAAEGPLGGLAVDRLGPPGSPLMAKAPRGLLVAGDRPGLESARNRSEGLPQDRDTSGIELSVARGAFARSRSLTLRRLSEALRDVHDPVLQGRLCLEDSRLEFRARGNFGPKPDDPATIEPGWLDWVPVDRAMVAFAVAIDPRVESRDAAFRLADRVERVDPARSNMAPLRLRLELLARGAGVRLESDVLPHLRGVSGWIGSGEGAIDGGLIAFHLGRGDVAGRLFSGIKPLNGNGNGAGADGARSLGSLQGRPLQFFRAGSTLLVSWGVGSLDASLAAHARPDGSAGPSLRRGWRDRRPSCAGGIWPGRISGLVPRGSPLALALAEAPPVVWKGAWDDGSPAFGFDLRSSDLRPILRRFLALIPLEPPPDR